MSEDDDGRVTLAIIQRDIHHLCGKVDRYHEETKISLAKREEDCREAHKDHEARLRSLEAGERQAMYRDAGTFATAMAGIIAGVLAALGVKP